MGKAKEALKNCYDENAKRQADALAQNLASMLVQFRDALDRSLAEHHGKDIAGVSHHAVLADNSCMSLDLWPSRERLLGPTSYHRNGEAFESCYTAELAAVVPELAQVWDGNCLREWGEAVAKSFSDLLRIALHDSASLSSREQAIQGYAQGLRSIVATQMISDREVVIEPSKLLRECSIRQDLRSTIPVFHKVLTECNYSHLRDLKAFTGINYETELDTLYSKRIEHAFESGRPYMGSKVFKPFPPGRLIMIAIFLGLIGVWSGIVVLTAIGALGVVAAIIGSLISKRQTRKRAMSFVDEVVGTFYEDVVSVLENSIRDNFQPQIGRGK
jgi:hypothetical protein